MLAFTLRGCQVKLRFSWFALLAFCCLYAEFSGGAFLWAAAALHEASHLAALFFFRAPPKAACFSALGCRLVLDPEKPLSYRQSALVSFAGPAANLLCFGAMMLLGWKSHPFAAANLALGILHCLPIEPLDGGFVLRSVLSGFVREKTAEAVSFAVSLLFLFPLALLGFFILLRTRYNFSLLALCVCLMLYLVLGRDLFMG